MLLVQKIPQEPFLSIFNIRRYLPLCNADLQSKLAANYAQNVEFVLVLLFYLKTQSFGLSAQRNVKIK